MLFYGKYENGQRYICAYDEEKHGKFVALILLRADSVKITIWRTCCYAGKK